MARLTKFMREEICQKMISERFDPIKKQIDVEEAALAVDVLKLALGDDYEKFVTLPKEWFLGEWKMHWKVGKYSRSASFGRHTSLPAFSAARTRDVEIDDPTIEQRYLAIKDRRHAYQREYEQVNAKIMAVLCASPNTDHLLERWPEAEPYLPKLVESKIRLPAINVADLNSALGLPKAEPEPAGSTAT